MNRQEARDLLLSDPDVSDAAIHYATGGLIDAEDLWWLWDEHRIMCDGPAWVLALMWSGDIDEDTAGLSDGPDFWKWYDAGRRK